MTLLIIFRVHGNTGKTPRHALSHDNKKEIVKFIKNYAEVHAIMLPGRIPGVKEYAKTHLLPSSTTRMGVYKEYVRAVTGEKVCTYNCFLSYWRKHVPDIRVVKAMSDLCWVCQQNSAAIVRSTNLPIQRQTTVRTCIINNYM